MKFHHNKFTKTQLAQVLVRIGKSIYEPIAAVEITAWRTREPVSFQNRERGEQLTLKIGDTWGQLFDCAWFRVRGQVPKTAAGQNLVLLIDLNAEALVVDGNGQPQQCLSPTSSIFDRRLGLPGKTVIPITSQATGTEEICIWLDVGNNDLFGNLQNNGRIEQACIAICHPELRALGYDYEVLLELMQQLPEDTARHQRILWALYRASIRLNEFNDSEARLARADLAPELARHNGDYPLHIYAIGHSHLDLAWLWPIRETIRKGARTFSNVLHLMARYPDFVFGASQAQLYQWMKEHFPALYARVKQEIARGRWEVLATTWVEPDTNLIGGEAFIRQFLYGKKFCREEFGIDPEILFLPDSFGYTAALPQIMKQCGVHFFLTIKLSWDRFNVYPHHSFWWQGIDGTSVLVHMPPEGTYNSSAAPRAVRKVEQEYLDKNISENCLLVYGIGDGGGGPGEEHLERLQREKNLEGIPPVTPATVRFFFDQLIAEQDHFATWRGELYLGMHQGTYTTQSRSKRYNRQAEQALHELEWLAAMAHLLAQADYPQPAIESIWKELLLYQFHDILPGSSITRVYDESLPRYAELLAEMHRLSLAAQSLIQLKINTLGVQQPIIVFNSLCWPRTQWLKIEDQWYWVRVPAMGYTTLEANDRATGFPSLVAQPNRLENEYLRVELDEQGQIRSIFDKENEREIVAPGAVANELIVYHDDGDAWDFSVDYRYRQAGSFALSTTSATTDGPRGIITQTRHFQRSQLIQRIALTAGQRQLDFESVVNWQEDHKMLRAQFPLNIRAEESLSEIQFGYIKRPTHRNTSWDHAKFEICAQKWIDLAQSDYGVALLKDTHYGHYAEENLLDINLLRSPSLPDPRADRGHHEFRYSLLPHAADPLTSGVIRAAYEFNCPLTFIHGSGNNRGDWPPTQPLVSIDVENVILETVKKAEDAPDIILRFYEAFGWHQQAAIRLHFPATTAFRTNLLEEIIEPVSISSSIITLTFKPFEITTIRLRLAT